MTTQTTHPQSTGEAMTSRAKELLVQILAAEWSVDKHSLWINADGVPKGPMHAADVRGWGFLTGRGHAHALDSESAFLIQKAIAHNIVDSHNAYRTLSSENARLTERVKVLEVALEHFLDRWDWSQRTHAESSPQTTPEDIERGDKEAMDGLEKLREIMFGLGNVQTGGGA